MPFTGSTIPAQPVVSEATRSRMLLQQLVNQGLTVNRPVVSSLSIAKAGNDVTIGDNLQDAQLIGIVGFTAGGATVTGATLLAEIASIAGATDDERVFIQACISSGFSLVSTAQLIFFIMTSPNIVITMTGGATSVKLHFYYLSSTYLVNP